MFNKALKLYAPSYKGSTKLMKTCSSVVFMVLVKVLLCHYRRYLSLSTGKRAKTTEPLVPSYPFDLDIQIQNRLQ